MRGGGKVLISREFDHLELCNCKIPLIMGEICKDYGSVIENRFEAMEKAVKKDIKYCLGVFTECRVLSVFRGRPSFSSFTRAYREYSFQHPPPESVQAMREKMMII